MCRPPVLIAVVIGALLTAPRAAPSARWGGTAGYRAAADAAPATSPIVAAGDSIAARRGIGWRSAGSREGLISMGGLPPTPGSLSLAGGSLVFRPADGSAAMAYPLFRLTSRHGLFARRISVALLEVDHSAVDAVYVFHLDGAVLETASPGVLEQLVAEPDRVDSLGDPWTTEQPALIDPQDTLAQLAAVHDLVASPYADTIFRLFGTPVRPVGLVGDRGQRAGRLGEFMASRDSVSVSPARMTSPGQLRHALAHELAHRWQRAAPDELAALWAGVPPIRDSLRYGYANEDEHQAEAVAFAVHFLQTAAAPALPADAARDLLDAYERLVPGTRVMVRRLVAQPLYRYHPLASRLLASAPRLAAGSRQSHLVDAF